jgi:hypothetical protein
MYLADHTAIHNLLPITFDSFNLYYPLQSKWCDWFVLRDGPDHKPDSASILRNSEEANYEALDS